MKNKSLMYIFSLLFLVVFLVGCQDQAGEVYKVAKTASNQTNQTGNLYVVSIPSGANLYVDNILKGTTPRTVTGLTVGNHAVKVTKTGYYDYTTTKYIYAGQTVNLTVTLVPINNTGNQSGNYTINNTRNQTGNQTNSTHKICSGTSCISVSGTGIDECTSNAQCGVNQTNQTGSLYASSKPTGASLYVDNIYRGLTPYTVYGLSVGNHAIKFTKIGYYDYTTTKYIYVGNNSISVILTPQNSTGNQTNSSAY